MAKLCNRHIVDISVNIEHLDDKLGVQYGSFSLEIGVIICDGVFYCLKHTETP